MKITRSTVLECAALVAGWLLGEFVSQRRDRAAARRQCTTMEPAAA